MQLDHNFSCDSRPPLSRLTVLPPHRRVRSASMTDRLPDPWRLLHSYLPFIPEIFLPPSSYLSHTLHSDPLTDIAHRAVDPQRIRTTSVPSFLLLNPYLLLVSVVDCGSLPYLAGAPGVSPPLPSFQSVCPSFTRLITPQPLEKSDSPLHPISQNNLSSRLCSAHLAHPSRRTLTNTIDTLSAAH